MARRVGFAAASLGASRRMLSSDAYVPLDEIAGAESIGRWYGSRLSREDCGVRRDQRVAEIVQCGEGMHAASTDCTYQRLDRHSSGITRRAPGIGATMSTRSAEDVRVIVAAGGEPDSLWRGQRSKGRVSATSYAGLMLN